MPRRRRYKAPVRHDQIWVNHQFGQSVVQNATVPTEFVLLEGSDWADASVGTERGTILTVVGNWYAYPGVVGAAGDELTLICGITMLDPSGGVGDMDSTSVIAGNDWLWTFWWRARFTTVATATGTRDSLQKEIHVKTKRRITSGEHLVFAVQVIGGGTNAMVVGGWLRTLLRRD